MPALPTCTGDGTTPCQVTGSAQTNSYCNPEYNAYPYAGNFLQFFDPNPATVRLRALVLAAARDSCGEARAAQALCAGRSGHASGARERERERERELL